jgi:hypothetical protein
LLFSLLCFFTIFFCFFVSNCYFVSLFSLLCFSVSCYSVSLLFFLFFVYFPFCLSHTFFVYFPLCLFSILFLLSFCKQWFPWFFENCFFYSVWHLCFQVYFYYVSWIFIFLLSATRRANSARVGLRYRAASIFGLSAPRRSSAFTT